MREKNNTFQEIADTLNKVGIPSRFGGRRVGGDKGCGWILPKGHDRRTGPQTVTRLAGRRVGGDKGCGWILPKGHDRRTGPQTVTRLAGKWHKTSVLRVANRNDLE